MAKEAYLYGKRGLFVWQTRPICMEKEAYLYGNENECRWRYNEKECTWRDLGLDVLGLINDRHST